MAREIGLNAQALTLATGANRMLLSPRGRFVAVELWLGVDPPLLKLIDREQSKVVAAGRGRLLTSPTDQGEVWTLGPCAEDRVCARPLGEADGEALPVAEPLYPGSLRVVPDAGGAGRGLLISQPEGPATLRLVDVASPANVVTLPLDPPCWVQAVTGGGGQPLIFLLTGPEGAGGAAVLALDANAQTRWRYEIEEIGVVQDPSLGLTGTSGTLVLLSSSGLTGLRLDAVTGASRGAFPLPFGPSIPQLVPVPGRPESLALRGDRGGQARIAWDALIIPESGDPVRVHREDAPAPGAAGFAGETLVLAPFAAPRLLSNPEEWGPEVADYL